MRITTFPLGPLQTNGFILEHDGRAVIIDVGGNPQPMLDHLGDDITLEQILITHLHFDHIYGVRALHGATGAEVLANAEDAFLMDTEVGRGGMMGLPTVSSFDFTPIEAHETEYIGLKCSVRHTPGHTPGSLSFYFPDAGAVFVGDVLFYRSVGRTDFPGGDAEVLKNSVKEQLFTLPPETIVLSGHGQQTSVGDEMNHNPFFTSF